MSSKHFISDPEYLVSTALESITLLNPNVALDKENRVVYIRPDAIEPQVSIVSGGGSGHEPSFAGFVGPGLLSASVAGTIFASPSAEQVRRAIFERVETKHGVLVIVMQYTGDVLNFGMAVEKAKAAGINVEMVIVGDDAAVGRKQGGKVGRRGIAGTVLVQKIAGALAARGAKLQDVARIASLVADNVVSMGSSLSRVHVPGRAVEKSEDDLEDDEVELGMGIHNESGTKKTTADLPNIVKTMLKSMLDTGDEDRAFLSLHSTDDVVLLVNNLGGVSVLEMGGIVLEVVSQLKMTHGITPTRILSGTYMTSLNGLGFSVSLLKLQDTQLNVSLLELLDAPSECTGFATAIQGKTWSHRPDQVRENSDRNNVENESCGIEINPKATNKRLKHALEKVIYAEPDITRFDTIVGDGDCGIGLKRGAQAVISQLDAIQEQKDLGLYLDAIIGTVEVAMDGTSGALYAIFLNSLVFYIRRQSTGSVKHIDVGIWTKALQKAMNSLECYTPAKPGDRTLIDSLAPFIQELQASKSFLKAAKAAEAGAASTRGMKASLGRTVYIGGDGVNEVPDPGAHGLAVFLMGLAEPH